MRALASLFILGILLFAGCAGKPAETTTTLATSSLLQSSTTPSTQAASSTTEAPASSTSTIQAAAADVRISGFSFDPVILTVSKGATVTWVNEDSAPHTIVGDSGVFSSGSLGRGDSFSHTFTDAGTFAYHCSIHPSMGGTVVVQ